MSQLRDRGMDIHTEDLARLSPLGYRHIHLLGRYLVALSADVPPAGFRALRQATEVVGSEDYSD